MFIPFDYVIDNVKIYHQDSFVGLSDHFAIKIQLPLQGDKSLTQLIIDHRKLERIKIEIFKSNHNFNLKTDIIKTDNL